MRLADRLSPERRSKNMARIRCRDTAPEIMVRQLLHSLGYRYRLCDSTLPGTPDIVFPSRRKVIFIHGCFWHRHPHCKYAYVPKSRVDFWQRKFAENVTRDAEALTALAASGWHALVIWECELRAAEMVRSKLIDYLGPPSAIQMRTAN